MAQFLYSNFLFVAKTWNFTKRYSSKYLTLQVKWCPDNCTQGKFPPGQLPPRWFPPDNCPPDNFPWRKLPPGQLPPRKTAPPMTIAPHHKISLEKNCPTQANSPQRVLRVNWGKLCIIYEYFNMPVLLLRNKKWFTSIYSYRFQLNLTEHHI